MNQLITLAQNSLDAVQKHLRQGFIESEFEKELQKAEIDLIELIAQLKLNETEDGVAKQLLRAFSQSMNSNLRNAEKYGETKNLYVLDWIMDASAKKCTVFLRFGDLDIWKFAATRPRSLMDTIKDCIEHTVWYFMTTSGSEMDDHVDQLTAKN